MICSKIAGRFGPAASCIAHGLDILARAEGENEAESLLHTQLKERKARLVQVYSEAHEMAYLAVELAKTLI